MSAELTKEDIFRLFAETDRRFKETEREIKEDFKETDRRLDKRFEETDRRLDSRFEETDRRLDRRFEETDKKIKELASLFTGQWGKLVEALVKPSALKLFQERDVNVTETYQRLESRRNGLFVLAGSGEGMIRILNNPDFQPKNFGVG